MSGPEKRIPCCRTKKILSSTSTKPTSGIAGRIWAGWLAGWLAASVGDPAEIFPINSLAHDDVVLFCTAKTLQSGVEIEAAAQLPLRSWIPTLKYNFVEITPQKISGRRFALGPAPERRRKR